MKVTLVMLDGGRLLAAGSREWVLGLCDRLHPDELVLGWHP